MKKLLSWFYQNPYFFLIFVVCLLFFYPVFQGKIPFPGDLLVNENSYKEESFLGYAPSGMPNKAQGPDVIKEIYPWRYFSVSEIKKGNLPFWNPHNFSGNPQLANFQTAVFYPLNLLYLILPFNTAWTVLIMLQPILAGIFMYLFLTKALKLSDFSSFIGAIAFAFSSYMTVWIEYGNIGNTFLWLPLALLFTKYFFKKLTFFNLSGLCISLFFAILAGYIQGVFYIYAVCFAYYNYLAFTTKGSFAKHKKIFLFLVALLLPILLTAFQILPTLELFIHSTRGHYSLSGISNNLLPIQYWITGFASDFFGNPATRNYWINGTYIERVMYSGVVILFFAFYAVFNSKKLEKKFFIVLSFLSLIIATNLPGIKFFYLLPIPVISTTIPTRELSIFIFSIIVLGVMGLDYWQNVKNYKIKPVLIFILVYILVWILLFLLPKFTPMTLENIAIAKRNLILPTFLSLITGFAFYFKKVNKNFSLIIITLIVCLDLFYFFQKITPFSPKELIYPKTPVMTFLQKNAGIDRFWGYGSAYIEPNFQMVDGTFSPEGNDPLHIAEYGKLLASSGTGNLPSVLPRPDANVAPGYGSDDLKNNSYRKRVLDILAVKYILHKNLDLNPDVETFPREQYKLLWQKTPWQIYENLNALPRFFITNKYLVVKDDDLVLKTIYSKNFDFKNFLLLKSNPEIFIDENSTGEAKLLSYTPNIVLFETNTNGNSILFISDNYYPDWDVFIDGKKEKIIKADYAFRAVAVPKGEHKVEFIYDPKSFKLGMKLSFAGFLIFSGFLFFVKKNEKEK